MATTNPSKKSTAPNIQLMGKVAIALAASITDWNKLIVKDLARVLAGTRVPKFSMGQPPTSKGPFQPLAVPPPGSPKGSDATPDDATERARYRARYSSYEKFEANVFAMNRG